MRFKVTTLLGVLLCLLAMAFYLWVGLTFGSWTDIGAYSIAVTLFFFGVATILTSLAPPPPTTR